MGVVTCFWRLRSRQREKVPGNLDHDKQYHNYIDAGITYDDIIVDNNWIHYQTEIANHRKHKRGWNVQKKNSYCIFFIFFVEE